jgi:hypothetical protein
MEIEEIKRIERKLAATPHFRRVEVYYKDKHDERKIQLGYFGKLVEKALGEQETYQTEPPFISLYRNLDEKLAPQNHLEIKVESIDEIKILIELRAT